MLLTFGTLGCALLMLSGLAHAGEITAIELHRDPYGQISATGDVHVKAEGFTIKAQSLIMDLDSQAGSLQDATVRFDNGYVFSGAMLERYDLHHFSGDNIIYTTCPDDEMAWRVVAKHATLDREGGTFIAEDAWFEFGGVPVLYTPRWENALSRRSGFLVPQLSQSSRRGVAIKLPFFWDAAPNWDMTFSPEFMSLRGTMADIEWRHRSMLGNEKIQVQSIFDRVTQTQRSRLQSDMGWTFSPNVDANVNINVVDDGFFISDFPRQGESEAQSFLTSSAAANWRWGNDSATVSTRYQQVLGGGSNDATLQVMPRLQTRHYFNWGNVENLQLEHQSTLFQRQTGVSGLRVGLRPSWRLPWSMQQGAIQAEWSVLGQYVDYQSKQFTENHASYAATASSLQLRSAFERLSENRQWRHTITPIIRLDVSNANNQTHLPSYDSSLVPLNLSNILQGNRYSGWDRFERMRKLSVLIDSSLQSKQDTSSSSRTMLNAQVGLVWDDLRQSVDAAQPNPTRSVSNLLAEVAWMPHEALRVSSGGQHDPDLQAWVESHANVHWQGERQQFFDMNWQKTDASYGAVAETVAVSGRAAFNQRWSAQGTSQYDRYRKRLLNATLGLNYDHPCWHLTTEAFKTFQVGSNNRLTDIGVRFLLAFEGLGSFGDK